MSSSNSGRFSPLSALIGTISFSGNSSEQRWIAGSNLPLETASILFKRIKTGQVNPRSV